MELKELIKEEKLTSLIQEEVENQRTEKAKQMARQVGSQIQSAVETLRACRRNEKTAKEALKKLNKAIEDYDKCGNIDVLRKAGFHV